jgi:hypothetical protein
MRSWSQVISRAAVMTALTPWSIRLECTARPVIVVRSCTEALCPVTTAWRVGSPTMTAEGVGTVWAISRIM